MSLRHAILASLSKQPDTGYTLGQQFSGTSLSFWTATQSQIYRELHELERDALVTVEVVPQDGKPARKVYQLTATGQQAFATWLSEPVALTPIRDAFLLKFAQGASVDPADLARLLEAHRVELEERRVILELGLEDATAKDGREAMFQRLAIESGLAACDAQLAWLEDAVVQLAAPADVGQAGF